MSVRTEPDPAETTAPANTGLTVGNDPTVEPDEPTILGPLRTAVGHTAADRTTQTKTGHAPVPPLLARLIGGFGRGLIIVGVLLLLFAGFQLWGTGVAEQRAQADLERRFEEQLAELVVPPPSERAVLEVPAVAETESAEPGDTEAGQTDPGATPPDPTAEPDAQAALPDPEFQPGVGDPVGMIDIPAIGVSKTIVEGTTRDVLREGPGHYRSTPLPGRSGNTAIAGHRTTHGAPFFDIDLLVPGDEISVQTLEGTAVYRVEAHDDGAGGEVGHLIVDPSEVGVIADKGDNRLTLTACHPKYSAAERIIVTATMVSGPALEAAADPAPAPATAKPNATGETSNQDGLGPDELTAVTAADRAHRQRAADISTELPQAGQQGQTGPDASQQADSDSISELNSEFNSEFSSEFNSEFDGDFSNEVGFGENTVGVNTVGGNTVAASLGWQPQFAPVTAAWAGFTLLIAVAGSVAGRLWRRFPAYAMAVPPLTLALFRCFTNLEKLLPAV